MTSDSPTAEPDESARPAEEAAETPSFKWYKGRIGVGLDTAWADDESDAVLDQTLELSITPPDLRWMRFDGSLWLQEDLDGEEPPYSTLRGIQDSYDSDVRAMLYQLNVSMDDLWGDSVLRIGRQRILEGPAFNRVDGVYFKQFLPQWDWYAFAGWRASLYEATFADTVAGGGASYRPTRATRIALDLYYGEEDRTRGESVNRGPLANLLDWDFPRRVERDLSDTLVSLSMYHDFPHNIHGYGRLNWQDGDFDELLLNVTGFVPTWDVTYEAAYRRRTQAAYDRVQDLPHFYRVLGEHAEYDNLTLAVHKAFAERYATSVEFELNDADEDDWWQGNRDYTRYGLYLAATPLIEKIDAELGFERWDTNGGEGTWAVVGEVARTWGPVRMALGADFERFEDRLVEYRPWLWPLHDTWVRVNPFAFQGYAPIVRLFDTYAVQTHENLHTVYVEGGWSLRENQDVNLRVSYEEDDQPESPYWRVEAAYELRF